MVRAKNEEQFLYSSVKSIMDHVDEVVIIDNLSSDATPRIARALADEYPEKITLREYRHTVARVGIENKELVSRLHAFRRFSPALLANYYNWCLRQCTKPYILKWDADSIATESFYRYLDEWRQSNKEILMFRGANLYADFRHLVAPPARMEPVMEDYASFTFANWVAPYTDLHASLFPKSGAHYTFGFWWCEKLETPWLKKGSVYRPMGVSFVHLKYCKRDPVANMSPELHPILEQISPGAPITKEIEKALREYGFLS